MQTNNIKEHQDAIYTILCEMDRVCKELEIPYYLFAGTLLGAIRHQGFIPWDDDLDIALKREDYEKFRKYGKSILDTKRFFLQEEFSTHWPVHFSKLRMNGTTCLEKFHPKDPKIHQGIYIDIFPIDNASDKKWIRKLQFYASKIVIAKALYNRGYETNSLLKKLFMAFCAFLPTKRINRFVRMQNKQTQYVHSFYGASSKMEKAIYPASIFEEKVQVKFNTAYFPAPKQYDALLTILYGDYRKIPSEEERKVKKHAILVDLTNSYEKYEHYRDDMKFEIHTKSIR